MLKTRTGRVLAILGAGTGNWLFNAGVLLVATPLYFKYLSQTGYGLWLFLLGTFGLFGLSDLGVVASVRPLAIKALAREDFRALRTTYSAALLCRLALAGFIVVLAWLCLPLVLSFGKVPSGLTRDFSLAYRVMLGALLVDSVGTVFQGLVSARQLEYRLLVPNLLRSAAAPVCSIWLLLHYRTLGAMAAGMLAASLLSCAVSGYVCRRSFQEISLIPTTPSRAAIRELFGLSIYFFIDSISAFLVTGVNQIVIQNVLGPSALSAYAISLILYSYLNGTCARMVSGATSGLADLAARGMRPALTEAMNFLNLSAVLVACSFVPLAFILNPVFVQHWISKGLFVGTSASVFMALQCLQSVILIPGYLLLSGTGVMRGKAWLTLCAGLLNLGSSVLLARKFGLAGVAAASFLSMLVTLTWFVPWRAGKLSGSTSRLWLTAIRVGLTLTMSGAGIAWVFSRMLFIYSPLQFWVIGILVAVVAQAFVSMMLAPSWFRLQLRCRLRVILSAATTRNTSLPLASLKPSP